MEGVRVTKSSADHQQGNGKADQWVKKRQLNKSCEVQTIEQISCGQFNKPIDIPEEECMDEINA